jgi:hypothetical protein
VQHLLTTVSCRSSNNRAGSSSKRCMLDAVTGASGAYPIDALAVGHMGANIILAISFTKLLLICGTFKSTIRYRLCTRRSWLSLYQCLEVFIHLSSTESYLGIACRFLSTSAYFLLLHTFSSSSHTANAFSRNLQSSNSGGFPMARVSMTYRPKLSS